MWYVIMNNSKLKLKKNHFSMLNSFRGAVITFLIKRFAHKLNVLNGYLVMLVYII